MKAPWIRVVVLALAIACATSSGCRTQEPKEGASLNAPKRSIEEVLAEHSPRLIAIEGVTAVGQGALPDGTPCIRVYLVREDAALRSRIPSQIEGYRVLVDVSGEIRALPEQTP